MGMNSVPGSMPSATVVPPTVSNEATANQVQERMQTANAAAGGKAGKKRSLLLPVLGIIVVLAIAAAGAFWWWSNQNMDASPVDLDNTLTQQESLPDEPVVTEGVVPRSDSVDNDFASAEITDDTPNTAEIFGLICEYENTHPAGVVAFYEPSTETLHRMPIVQDTNVYSMKVPAGDYMAFFEPTNRELPIFAFSQYVNCGMTPDSCTDHSMVTFTVEADQEYGQVDLCDPQYVQDGLPTELQYENS